VTTVPLRAAAVVLILAASCGAADPLKEPLERRVARMLLVGTRGYEFHPGGDFERFICDYGVGGVLLFDRNPRGSGGKHNIRGRRQLTKLADDLQAAAERCGDAPLLIAADVEGGKVNRLASVEGVETLKSAAWLGARPPRRTYDEARRISEAMFDTGLNWNLAPVLDVNLNPKNPIIGKLRRSFSEKPAEVAARAKEFVRAHRDLGMLTCVKHFPGHGSSARDSHKGAVDVTDSAVLEVELAPYESLLEENLVDCVMPGHLYNRSVDPERMMTVSSAAIRGLLREELGFDGLVLSDDMQMGAVKEAFPIGEAAVQAVLAGVDMLTLSFSRARARDGAARRVREALVDAVLEGRIPEARIDEANRRILELKARLETSFVEAPPADEAGDDG
jgi:beta-N-acetylhexosaminidase